MKKILIIIAILLFYFTSNSEDKRKQSVQWMKVEDITNTRNFIWHGDTIDFTHFVDSLYVNYADTVAMIATQYWVDSLGVMLSDSTIYYVTPQQLKDSLDATISHDALSLSSTALASGLTLLGQELSFQPANSSQNGYLTSTDYSLFYGKISSVSHNETMTGLGTSISPLKVDTTKIATINYVDNYGGGSGSVVSTGIPENLHITVYSGTSGDTIINGGYTIAEVLNLGNATGTLDEGNIDPDIARDSEVPEISDIAYDATTWDGNLDGATKNSIRDKLESLSGGHDAVTIGTANGLSLNVQELSMGLSGESSTGALSSTDWNIFNNKVSSPFTLDTYGAAYSGGNIGLGLSSVSTSRLFSYVSSTALTAGLFRNTTDTGISLVAWGGGSGGGSAFEAWSRSGDTSFMKILGTGKINIGQYGSGKYTGTATKWLAVTSGGDIIEQDAPSGTLADGDKGDITVSGSGTTWTVDSLAFASTRLSDAANIAYKNVANSFMQDQQIYKTDPYLLFKDDNYSSLGEAVKIGYNGSTYNQFEILTTGASVNLSFKPNYVEKLKLLTTGQLRLNGYTSTGSFTGTSVGVLGFDANGYITTEPLSSGGSTSPGGSAGNIQYNNAGSFGGFGYFNGSYARLDDGDFFGIYDSGNTASYLTMSSSGGSYWTLGVNNAMDISPFDYIGFDQDNDLIEIIGADFHIAKGLYDSYGSKGTSGQILSSTASGIDWIDPPTGGSMTYPAAGIALSTGTAWGTSITNNSTNWNTAYTDRLKWDGGSTGLTASTGRTSLGATTVGSSFFTTANPSAITFPRVNADNTVSYLDAASFRTAIGAGSSTSLWTDGTEKIYQADTTKTVLFGKTTLLSNTNALETYGSAYIAGDVTAANLITSGYSFAKYYKRSIQMGTASSSTININASSGENPSYYVTATGAIVVKIQYLETTMMGTIVLQFASTPSSFVVQTYTDSGATETNRINEVQIGYGAIPEAGLVTIINYNYTNNGTNSFVTLSYGQQL